MSVTVTPYFKPTSITGCQLWLDATDTSSLTGSSPVTAWKNKIIPANNIPVFATNGGSPSISATAINGNPAMYFNGSSYFTGAISAASSTTITIFMVGSLISPFATFSGLLCFGNSSQLDYDNAGSLVTSMYGGDSKIYGYRNGDAQVVPVTANVPFIFVLQHDGTYVNTWFNGTQQTSVNIGSSGTFTYTNYSVACRAGTITGQYIWSGYFGEILVYQSSLTTTQRTTVEAYLAQKWGLTSSLPSGHFGLMNKLYASSSPAIQVTPYTSVSYAFAPTQISGCQLWLDAADPAGTGVVPAAGVQSTWVDKSTNGWNATQATAGRQPSLVLNSLNGLPGFSFTNANNQSFATAAQASLNSISGLSVFAVLLPTWASGAAVANPSFFGFRLYNHGVTKINYYVHNNYSATDIYNGSGVFYHTGSVTTSAIGQNKVFIYSGTNNNGTDITYPNGSLTGDSVSVGFGSGTNLPIIVGGDNADGECWQGYIYEVIFYNTVLGSTDRQKVESYLAQKWGIRSSLAAAHPGLTINYFLHQFMTTRGAITALAPAIFQLKYAVSGLQFHLDAGNLSSYPRSGSTWYDLAGSGLTTTLYGSPTYSSGNGGSILFVPSSSQYGRTSAALPTLTRWTVEVWYYYTANNVGGLPCLISDIYNVSGGSSINFVLGNIRNNTVNLAALFYDLAYSSGWNGDSTYVFPSVGWYHVVGTYDGANIKLYINGSLNNTTATANTPTSGGLGIHLMRRWDSVGYEDFWGGYLSIVRIYNRALSLSEIGVNYNGSRQRFLLP